MTNPGGAKRVARSFTSPCSSSTDNGLSCLEERCLRSVSYSGESPVEGRVDWNHQHYLLEMNRSDQQKTYRISRFPRGSFVEDPIQHSEIFLFHCQPTYQMPPGRPLLSKTVTSSPARFKCIAAAMPLTPAPMIATFRTLNDCSDICMIFGEIK